MVDDVGQPAKIAPLLDAVAISPVSDCVGEMPPVSGVLLTLDEGGVVL